MREYGKVATRFWTDPEVLKLSPTAKMVFLYLLAGPETNLIGCFRVTHMHVAASEVCSPDEAEAALVELAGTDLLEYDTEAKVVFLPNFLKYNPICNASSGKAALKALKTVPDSPLLSLVIPQLVEIFAGSKWVKELPTGWRHECEHMCRHECPDKCPLPIPSYTHPKGGNAREGQPVDNPVENPTVPTGTLSDNPPPSGSQATMLEELAAERGQTIQAACTALGIDQLGRKDVTRVKDWLKAQARPDPGKAAMEERNARLRSLKADLALRHERDGPEAARQWIEQEDHDPKVLMQLRVELSRLEKSGKEAMA